MGSRYKIFGKQRGQSMVEYAVIMSTLGIALITFNDPDPRGKNVYQLQDAFQDRQRGYTYAASLSALPETDNYRDLANYYDSLGKYPELASEMHSVADPIYNFADSYRSFMDRFKTQPPKLPERPTLPSLPRPSF